MAPYELTLELQPRARLDLIDVNEVIEKNSPGLLAKYPRALYYSYHTTAGYFEQSLCQRLNYDSESLEALVRSFQQLFPPEADYRHDQMDLREELSEAQKCDEPRNGDSHLTYIGSGLTNCVTYSSLACCPVHFIDLDGQYQDTTRRRKTTVVGFNRERCIDEFSFQIPVSKHAIDSVNVKDAKLGLYEMLADAVRRDGIATGRIDIRLSPNERHAGLTVNEYETLLMKHDLAEVLWNPLRFMAEKGKHMLQDPRAIPVKAKDYAKYDLVRLVNEFIDKLGLNESLLERVVDKFLQVPASRFLRMKRGVSLLVSDDGQDNDTGIRQGTYQSPVLVQWRKAEPQTRTVDISLVQFE